jgi:hypothetical protein
MMRSLVWVVGLGLSACGGEITTREVDVPVGQSVAYGAPRSTSFWVEAEPELDVLRLRVYRESRCDVIPVDRVRRRVETLEGGEVVKSEEQAARQVARPPSGEAACELGYARDSEISLVVGNAVHRLGTTDARGYVSVNLSAELREKLFGVSAPPEGLVRVRAPQALETADAGMISLASLRDYESGVTKLLAELGALLGRGTELTGSEIQRSYELYESLRALAWFDPRFKAASARFWELFAERKREDATAALARDLRALDSARELLRSASDATVPLFMQLALNGGTVDDRAQDWAYTSVLSAFRAKPAACNGFDWSRVSSYGFAPDAAVALYYLRYVQADALGGTVTRLCSFTTR